MWLETAIVGTHFVTMCNLESTLGSASHAVTVEKGPQRTNSGEDPHYPGFGPPNLPLSNFRFASLLEVCTVTRHDKSIYKVISATNALISVKEEVLWLTVINQSHVWSVMSL